MVERADISQVLSQMRLVQAQINRPAPTESLPGAIAPGQLARPQESASFGAILGRAIDTVNGVQQDANRLRESYEAGTPGVSLTQVMIAAEKSSVSFEAMLQVRNKLVQAYQDIMNMPV